MPKGFYIRTDSHLKQLREQINQLAKKPRTEKQRKASILNATKMGSLPRTDKQLKQVQFIGSRKGSNHPAWKGGITKLWVLLRMCDKNRNWQLKCMERDHYRCCDCGKDSDGDLQVHHIKRFSIILNEFLNLNFQYSLIKDRDILFDLALQYSPFWDVDNGKTLCEDCHKQITIQMLKQLNKKQEELK